MKKISLFHLLMLLMLVVVSTSCSKTFRIEGNIQNLGNQNLLFVWATEDGVKNERHAATNNRFDFEGASGEPTLVMIYDAQNQLLAHLVMENGDHLKVRGDATQSYSTEVKGSDINERWYDFIAQHRSEYKAFDRKPLDAAIEKYVEENTDDLLSTLLVMADYSQLNNRLISKQLLDKIDKSAKPDWLMHSWERLVANAPKSTSKIASLLLWENTGDFGAISTNTAKATLLYLWVNNSSHPKEMSPIKALAEEFPDAHQLQICDIYIDADTSSWRGYTSRDGSTWRHFWAPEGPLNSQLKPLAIATTPLYVVTDSLGNVVYNGAEASQATQKARTLIK
ncbi:MAG: DUF4369 domain-containing protein [Sodaliphilus sp.]